MSNEIISEENDNIRPKFENRKDIFKNNPSQAETAFTQNNFQFNKNAGYSNNVHIGIPPQNNVTDGSLVSKDEFESRIKLLEKYNQDALDKNSMRMDYVESAQKEIRDTYKSLRNTIITTAIATVIGLASLNYSLFNNMRDSFDLGKALSDETTKTNQNMQNLSDEIKQLKEQLKELSVHKKR